MKRKSMTRFVCCVCGHTSLVRINFKFDNQQNAYCIKNGHAVEAVKFNPQINTILKNELPVYINEFFNKWTLEKIE